MSITTSTEEANLKYNEKCNDDIVKAIIEDAMPELLRLEKTTINLSNITRDSDLEDACAKFYDDVLPVFKEYLR